MGRAWQGIERHRLAHLDADNNRQRATNVPKTILKNCEKMRKSYDCEPSVTVNDRFSNWGCWYIFYGHTNSCFSQLSHNYSSFHLSQWLSLAENCLWQCPLFLFSLRQQLIIFQPFEVLPSPVIIGGDNFTDCSSACDWSVLVTWPRYWPLIGWGQSSQGAGFETRHWSWVIIVIIICGGRGMLVLWSYNGPYKY